MGKFAKSLAIVLLTSPLIAQVNYGTLVGLVEDPNGGTIAGATVKVTKTDTAQARQILTGATGNYSVPDLLPGIYTLQISAPGFRTFSRTEVLVTVNTVSRFDVRMQLGQVNEVVEVQGDAAMLQADKADIHVNLGSKEIVNLPLPNYRNFQSLINLVPGSTPGKFQNTIFGSPGRALSTNINGTNRNNNNTRLDGAANIRVGLPHQIRYVPPAESIEAVNVSTNNFDAEQGFAGGAAVTVVTKSGSNSFHGVAFEHHGNAELNAKDFFYQEAKKPKSIMNIYGGTLGGPIRKDKIFFFVSYEAMRQRDNFSKFVTIPTDSQRAGNFNGLGSTIYDPATGNADGSGRTPFPNATVPFNRQSAITLKLQDLIPAPNLSGNNSNYFASAPVVLDKNNYDIKTNWNKSTSTSIWAKYSAMPTRAVGSASLGAAGGSGMTDGGGLGTSDFLAQFATVGYSHIFSPSFIVDGVIGFGRDSYANPGPDYGTMVGLDVLHIPGTNGPEIRYSGTPIFNITGYEFLGSGPSYMPQFEDDSSLTYTTNFGWSKSAHDIRFGLDVARYWVSAWKPENGGRGPRGSFGFDGGITALRNGASPTQFNAWAAYLLGLPQNMGKSIQFYVPMAANQWLDGLYFRDRWQAMRNLTVTLGLRWEYHPPYSRPNTGLERYDPDENKVYIGGLGGTPQNAGVTVSKRLFSPRIGLAYRVGQKSVIRMGYGISIDPTPVVRTMRGNYPAVVNQDFIGASTYQAVGTIENGIPLFTGPDISKGVIDMPLNATTLTLEKGLFRRGYIQSFNALVERQLPMNFIGSIAYVGTRTVRQAAQLNINAGAPGSGAAGTPYAIKYGRTVTTNVYTNLGDGVYHSLQAQLDRRFSEGVMIKTSYTWGKVIDWSADAGGSLAYNHPSVLWRNRALADFDRTQTLRIATIVEPPFGRGKRFANDGVGAALLGGWQINGIFSAYSGLPFTVSAAGTSLNAPGNSQTADQVKSTVEKLGGIGRDVPFYDPLAFRAVTAVRFGNTGKDILRGPGVINLDAGVFRNFKVSERVQAQFRADSFNISNTPHFANPNSNVSNMSLNADGSIRSLGNFMAITSTAGGSTNAEGSARQFRFGIRFSF